MKKWIAAFRLRTLPLAVSSIIAGCALAIHIKKYVFVWSNEYGTIERNGSTKEYIIMAMAILTAILLQVLSNLANDYGDFVKGTDNENRVGPERAMQSGAISKKQMKMALIINSILAFCSGVFLLWLSFGNNWKIFSIYIAVGIACIIGAIKYTVGKNPYGYRAMGDLFVFIFFGLIGVLGSYYLIRQEINLEVVLLAISMGCFSVMVLNLNNMRDIENDAASNKITIPVKIGLDMAKSAYHPFLLLLGWTCLIVMFLYLDLDSMLLIFVPAYIFIKHLKFVLLNDKAELFNPELKKISLGTFFVSLAIFLATLLFYNF